VAKHFTTHPMIIKVPRLREYEMNLYIKRHPF